MTLIAHWPLAGAPGDSEDGQAAPDIAAGGSGAHDGIFEVSASEPLKPWGSGNTHLFCNELSSGYVHTFSNLADLRGLQGTMTVACWRKKYQSATGTDYGYLASCGGGDETQAANYQWQFRSRINGALELFWENGLGVDVLTASITGLLPNNGGWHHVAAVRYQISPGFYGVKYFVDGVLADTQDNGGGGFPGPDGGSASVFYIGRNTNAQPPGNTDYGVDSVRVYDTDESANISSIYASEIVDHEPVPRVSPIESGAIAGTLGSVRQVSPGLYGVPAEVALQVFQGERSGRENAGFSSARV